MGNLEERRRSVQLLFRPDGSLTHSGAILFQVFNEGCKQASGGRGEIDPEGLAWGQSEEGMRTVRRTFLPADHKLHDKSRLRDPFAGGLIRDHNMGEVKGPGVKLAFKKEGWGALLEEHPRGCIAYRLTAWGGRPVVEAALILPHPRDQVSEENRLHAFELEGGGVACWDYSGLQLTSGDILFSRQGGLQVQTFIHYTPSEADDGRRDALMEASVMRGASYAGLRTLAARLQLPGFARTESMLDWDPHRTRQKRAEALLNKATLALANHASALLFLEPKRWEFSTDGPCAVQMSGQPLSAQGLERFARGDRLVVMLRLEWGKQGVLPSRRFEGLQKEPEWVISCLDQDFRERGPVPLPAPGCGCYNLDTEEGFAAFSEELIKEGMLFLIRYLEVCGW